MLATWELGITIRITLKRKLIFILRAHYSVNFQKFIRIYFIINNIDYSVVYRGYKEGWYGIGYADGVSKSSYLLSNHFPIPMPCKTCHTHPYFLYPSPSKLLPLPSQIGDAVQNQ